MWNSTGRSTKEGTELFGLEALASTPQRGEIGHEVVIQAVEAQWQVKAGARGGTLPGARPAHSASPWIHPGWQHGSNADLGELAGAR